MSPASLVRGCTIKAANSIISTLGFIVFLYLDFLEIIFCIIYRFLDKFFEGKACSCYCESREAQEGNAGVDAEGIEMSETLYRRQNVFRQTGLLGFARKWENCSVGAAEGKMVNNNKWSDCGCESCVSWMKDGSGQKLHVVMREPSRAANADSCSNLAENVIFLHGFLSSSSFWTETVFPNLSESGEQNYRLFAVDLLGFGRSPKPNNCFYTLKDHLEMIEKSVIHPFELKSFHVVAYSMGCIIALALAAKYSDCVKSITLVAPPYFPSSKEEASLVALQKLAGKKLWPPLLFGSSFMSWYEHLGRCVCLLICRNHRIWENILKLLTWRRDLHFIAVDLTRHTHHSAWHTMHNVVCGGAKFMDDYLETLMKSKVKFCVIQGDSDNVVPLECSHNFKSKVTDAQVSIVPNADHVSVVIGRDRDFTINLELIWTSIADPEFCLEDDNSSEI